MNIKGEFSVFEKASAQQHQPYAISFVLDFYLRKTLISSTMINHLPAIKSNLHITFLRMRRNLGALQ